MRPGVKGVRLPGPVLFQTPAGRAGSDQLRGQMTGIGEECPQFAGDPRQVARLAEVLAGIGYSLLTSPCWTAMPDAQAFIQMTVAVHLFQETLTSDDGFPVLSQAADSLSRCRMICRNNRPKHE